MMGVCECFSCSNRRFISIYTVVAQNQGEERREEEMSQKMRAEEQKIT